MKYIILIILIFLLIIRADWSEPVKLSVDYEYPTLGFQYTSITTDHNGKIYAFWGRVVEIENDWIMTFIESRSSTDGGNTWSEIENVTPEHSDERVYGIQSVCDSNNNIHLAYVCGYTVTYKRFDGTAWSDSTRISRSSTNLLKMGIDNRDRIYLTWISGDYTMWTYCDATQLPIQWEEADYIAYEMKSVSSDLIFDEDNNLYATGGKDKFYPCFYKFDPVTEIWSFEDMYDDKCWPDALVLNNDNVFYSILTKGLTTENEVFYCTKSITDSLWSNPYVYFDDNIYTSLKDLFCDNKNNLHLFHMRTDNGCHLVYSKFKDDIWEEETFATDSLYNFEHLNVSMNENDFNMIYRKARMEYPSSIYYRHRPVVSAIEDHESQIENFCLYQNYPNPFNNQTEIEFSLNQNCEVELNIYNVKGEFVKNLVKTKLLKGNHTALFQADDLNSGIYYYQLKADGVIKNTKRMVYLK